MEKTILSTLIENLCVEASTSLCQVDDLTERLENLPTEIDIIVVEQNQIYTKIMLKAMLWFRALDTARLKHPDCT